MLHPRAHLNGMGLGPWARMGVGTGPSGAPLGGATLRSGSVAMPWLGKWLAAQHGLMQQEISGKFQEHSRHAPKGVPHAWCVLCPGLAQVGAGIVGWLVAQGQHGGVACQDMCPNSLCIQVGRTGPNSPKFSNAAQLVCTQPLLQAHGGPQPKWWPFGGPGVGPSHHNDGFGWFAPWRLTP